MEETSSWLNFKDTKKKCHQNWKKIELTFLEWREIEGEKQQHNTIDSTKEFFVLLFAKYIFRLLKMGHFRPLSYLFRRFNN